MARLRASWRTSLPVVQQPRNPQSESIARSPYHSWAGYRALPSSPFETLALSSAAELVGVARPRCAGSVTRESDISNGENGDISIGRLQRVVLPNAPQAAKPLRLNVPVLLEHAPEPSGRFFSLMKKF